MLLLGLLSLFSLLSGLSLWSGLLALTALLTGAALTSFDGTHWEYHLLSVLQA